MDSYKNILKCANTFTASLQKLKCRMKDSATLSERLIQLHINFTRFINIIEEFNKPVPVNVKLNLISTKEIINNTHENQVKKQNEYNQDIHENNLTYFLRVYEDAIYDFKIVVHSKYGLLSVETGSALINQIIMYQFHNRKDLIADLEIYLNMYRDFENKKCNRCGFYTDIVGLEPPVVRKLDGDYVLAYHRQCC